MSRTTSKKYDEQSVENPNKDNNQNTDKVTQLEDEIDRIEQVKEDMAEQIKYLQLQLE